MKLAEGFTRALPSVLLFVFYAASFALMTLALKKLDVGLVYAFWSGVGTALIAIIGAFLFQETFTPLKTFGIVLIIAGVVALNLGGASS
jgi:small multidrug resistance pump